MSLLEARGTEARLRYCQEDFSLLGSISSKPYDRKQEKSFLLSLEKTVEAIRFYQTKSFPG